MEIRYQDQTTKKIVTGDGKIVNVYTLSRKQGMQLCSVKFGDALPVVRWVKRDIIEQAKSFITK